MKIIILITLLFVGTLSMAEEDNCVARRDKDGGILSYDCEDSDSLTKEFDAIQPSEMKTMELYTTLKEAHTQELSSDKDLDEDLDKDLDGAETPSSSAK